LRKWHIFHQKWKDLSEVDPTVNADIAYFIDPAPKASVGRKHELPDWVIQKLGGLVRGFLTRKKCGMTVHLIAINVKVMLETDAELNEYVEQRKEEGKSALDCKDSWIRDLMMKHWNLRRRKGTQAARKVPENSADIGRLFQHRLAYMVSSLPAEHPLFSTFAAQFQHIPKSLVVNSDQTSLNLIHLPSYTWAEKGVKAVPLTGMDDKRCVTGVVGSAADGTLLPLQLVYAGKTSRTLPREILRREAEQDGFHFTFSDNHWSNQLTMCQYVQQILVPYYKKVSRDHVLPLVKDGTRHLTYAFHLLQVKADLELPEDYPTIWIIDCWSVHISQEFREWMTSIHPSIHLLYVPANCTSLFQPADVSLQRPIKQALTDIGMMYVARTAKQLFKEGDGADGV
jgi:hypothetical protein